MQFAGIGHGRDGNALLRTFCLQQLQIESNHGQRRRPVQQAHPRCFLEDDVRLRKSVPRPNAQDG